MCSINFVKEFNSFMEYAQHNMLSMREKMLWIALFYIANTRARYNPLTQTYDWPDGFMLVSNDELHMMANLDKKAVLSVRNQLRQRGLIDFKAGARNTEKPSYRIIYFSAEVGRNFTPNNAPNMGTNTAPNNAPNMGTNTPPTMPPFIVNYNNNPYSDISREDEEGGTKDGSPDPDTLFARAQETAKNAFNAAYGVATPAIIETVARMAVGLNLDGSLITAAVNMAARHMVASPVDYIGELFRDWHYQRIRDEGDLGRYMYLRDNEKGKYLHISRQEAREQMEIDRKERPCL